MNMAIIYHRVGQGVKIIHVSHTTSEPRKDTESYEYLPHLRIFMDEPVQDHLFGSEWPIQGDYIESLIHKHT